MFSFLDFCPSVTVVLRCQDGDASAPKASAAAPSSTPAAAKKVCSFALRRNDSNLVRSVVPRKKQNNADSNPLTFVLPVVLMIGIYAAAKYFHVL